MYVYNTYFIESDILLTVSTCLFKMQSTLVQFADTAFIRGTTPTVFPVID
jgi:hypothetical protein